MARDAQGTMSIRRDALRMRFLAASLAMHLLVLGLAAPGNDARAPARLDASLRWIDPAPAPRQAQIDRVRRAIPTARPNISPPPRPDAPPPDGARVPAALPPPPVPSSGIEVADLLKQARGIARETAAPSRSSRHEDILAPDRPILPALERALRREAAGEYRLGNGLIRVVGAGGLAYCLREPAELARAGPIPPLAVPTNCP